MEKIENLKEQLKSVQRKIENLQRLEINLTTKISRLESLKELKK